MMLNRYPKVAPYALLVKLKDFVVDDICRNVLEGHSDSKKHNLGNLFPKEDPWEASL